MTKKRYKVASPILQNDINWVNKRVTKILKGRLALAITKEFEKKFC